MGLLSELRRRNVIRMAVLYVVAAWLIMQVAEVVITLGALPNWTGQLILILLAVGFPISLIVSWFYELTPEGISLEKDVEPHESITHITGRRIDFIVISLLCAAVLLFAYDKWWTSGPPIQSIAVLPFVNMSDDPDNEYFTDGLTVEVLNSLTQLSGFRVTGRTSSFVFKGKDVPIPEAAEKLGVAHIVEGSVRRDGKHIRVTAQLIRAVDGFQLWSETYDRSAEDSFAVQANIAEKVAAALDVVLSEDQLERMRSTGLRNPEAFVAFQKGWELFSQAHSLPYTQRQIGLLDANKYFEQTIELEPRFSPAHFIHYDYYVHRIVNAVSLDDLSNDAIAETLGRAKTDLENASRYAANEAQRLNATAEFALLAGHWKRLPDLVAAAVNLPECVGAGSWWSESQWIGSPSQALRLWEKERECDPLSPHTWSNIAIAQILLGDFEAAIDTAKRGMQSAPHRQTAEQLIHAYIAIGQFDKAEAATHRFINDERTRHSYRHKMAAAKGDSERAQELLDEMIDKFGIDSANITNFATAGNRDAANQLAARLDARPLGIFSLFTSADFCYCGAPFDLEETPNFARLIEEARLPWPPPAPINWPLKDW